MVLEHYGFTVVYKDEFHYLLAKQEDKTAPILIPRDLNEDGCVAVEVMESALFEGEDRPLTPIFPFINLFSTRGVERKIKKNGQN